MTLGAAIRNSRINVCGHYNARWDNLGLIRPGNIFERARRAGINALLAEIAFGRLCSLAIDRSVQGHHVPGTRMRADAAAYAVADIYHPGVERCYDLNGVVRTCQLAGYRVRALAARILNSTEVAPEPVFPHEPLIRLHWAYIIVSADFDAGDRGL